MYKLAVLVGSLKKESMNKKLAHGLAELGKDLFEFDFLNLESVPMFSEDLEKNLPGPVVELKNKVAEADAMLIVTPEYNRSYPALVKNTLDWCSRPAGQSVLGGKPLAIAGMSPGAVGTAVSQSHLRSIVGFLGMKHLGQPELYLQFNPEFFDASGKIASERTREFLGSFLKSFSGWIDSCK